MNSQFFATAIIRSKAKGKPKTKLVPASTLELQLTAGGGRARLVLLGRESEAIRVANTVYVKSSPAFYTSLARRTGVHVALGTWLKSPADGAQLTEYTALTEPGGELMLLLRDPTLSLTKGHTTTIKGQRVIELKTQGRLYSGAIYIAATGDPYPIEIVEHGRENARITFTNWNQPAPLAPPANAVELPQPRG